MFDLTRPGARRRFTLAVIRLHHVLYRLSGGRLLGRVVGLPVLLLTTTGRRSGRLRTTPLTYLDDAGSLVVIASAGGSDLPPGWSRNLEAHPEVVVRRGRTSTAMTARRASPSERERLWPRIIEAYPGYARYQGRTERTIAVFLLDVHA